MLRTSSVTRYLIIFSGVFLISSVQHYPRATHASKKQVVSWEFRGDRKPDHYELTLLLGKPKRGATCDGILDDLYAVYQRQHPPFRSLAELPGMRKRWRAAMLMPENDPNDYLLGCGYEDLIGRFERNPFSELPLRLPACPQSVALWPSEKRDAQALAEELLTYAMAGADLVANFFIGGLLGDRIRLHPRIRYYLESRFVEENPPDSDWGKEMAPFLTPDHAWRLTDEERLFIDSARRDGDYASVLNSIDRCEWPDEPAPARAANPHDI